MAAKTEKSPDVKANEAVAAEVAKAPKVPTRYVVLQHSKLYELLSVGNHELGHDDEYADVEAYMPVDSCEGFGKDDALRKYVAAKYPDKNVPAGLTLRLVAASSWEGMAEVGIRQEPQLSFKTVG